MHIIAVILILGAYLLGSVASAIIVCKAMGLTDPRTLGSGNPGATNVLRTGNKFAAVLTLIGDILKGLVPVLIAQYAFDDSRISSAAGLAALLGHVFPLWHGFKGGKGVATFLGALLGWHWLLAGTWILLWVTVAIVFRISSLAALVATLSIPIIALLLHSNLWLVIAIAMAACVVIWRHKENIQRLLHNQEPKMKFSRS